MIVPSLRRNEHTGKPEGVHCMFIGRTGSGKTFLAEHALEEREYVVVHDGKGTFREKPLVRADLLRKGGRWEVCRTVDDCVRSKAPRICYSPARKDLLDLGEQAAFFEWILRRQNTTLLIDEYTLVCDGQNVPDPLLAIYATGRELCIEAWGCTQQPVMIPNIAYTQSQFFAIFHVALDVHRTKIRSFVPVSSEQLEGLSDREYYAYRDTWRVAEGPLTYDDALEIVRPSEDALTVA